MYSIKGKPFVYNGVVDVSDCKTCQEVMEKSNLAWTVKKARMFAEMPIIKENENEVLDSSTSFPYGANNYKIVDNIYATYRTDLNIPLGAVKDRYAVVQNIDAFKFFDDAIDKNTVVWKTAGCFNNGSKIFVSAKLSKISVIGEDDAIENYLVFMTSHDGTLGVKILITPVRVICENTLNLAIEKASNCITFRHTNSVHTNINEFINILRECDGRINEFERVCTKFLKTKIDDKEAKIKFAKLILTDKELDNIYNTGHYLDELYSRSYNAMSDCQISMKKINTLTQIYDYYHVGIGQRKYVGTAWGIYNAITGYYSNVVNSSDSRHMESILYGSKASKIKKIGELLLTE